MNESDKNFPETLRKYPVNGLCMRDRRISLQQFNILIQWASQPDPRGAGPYSLTSDIPEDSLVLAQLGFEGRLSE